jgi:hypothetical protein
MDAERWVHAVLSKTMKGLEVTIEEYPELKLPPSTESLIYNLLTKAYYLMDHVDDMVHGQGKALVRIKLRASTFNFTGKGV